ncbi:MAG: ABC transporter permease [Chloroflexi bacterium]|nr:ABC transporter permease [Chloroflexota bacterium]MBK6710429.1 ABC transporter permease [Chloroflexota bacterium]MBK7180623.1 ABC transporter permease [Chloroflexota bacterium]MBK7917646.1 ABC transporter permease [Chloroflexota bacterium]MBK8934639.1 ABC transporter permease [Chloroflexota bacterium]
MTTLIIAQLTIRETQRRRILWIVVLLALGFLGLYALGFHYIYAGLQENLPASENRNLFVGALVTMGLYVTNFLIALMTVLMSAASVSGEIESHTADTLVTKPIRRWELILGKWLGFSILLLGYILLLPGGVILISIWQSGLPVANVLPGLSLILLQGLILLSLSLAGGTRLSTLANGAMAFMIYGIAFLGSWTEQIGALFENQTAVNIGIVTSLIMPSEALWKKALALFQPGFASSPVMAGPLAVTSQPSDLMIGYAVAYMVALLALALWSFSRRDL